MFFFFWRFSYEAGGVYNNRLTSYWAWSIWGYNVLDSEMPQKFLAILNDLMINDLQNLTRIYKIIRFYCQRMVNKLLWFWLKILGFILWRELGNEVKLNEINIWRWLSDVLYDFRTYQLSDWGFMRFSRWGETISPLRMFDWSSFSSARLARFRFRRELFDLRSVFV